MFIYIRIIIHTYIIICIYMHIYTYTYAYNYIYNHIYIYTCNMHTCIFTYIHIHIYILLYINLLRISHPPKHRACGAFEASAEVNLLCSSPRPATPCHHPVISMGKWDICWLMLVNVGWLMLVNWISNSIYIPVISGYTTLYNYCFIVKISQIIHMFSGKTIFDASSQHIFPFFCRLLSGWWF
jgi:hypothetical protein